MYLNRRRIMKKSTLLLTVMLLSGAALVVSPTIVPGADGGEPPCGAKPKLPDNTQIYSDVVMASSEGVCIDCPASYVQYSAGSVCDGDEEGDNKQGIDYVSGYHWHGGSCEPDPDNPSGPINCTPPSNSTPLSSIGRENCDDEC